MCYCFCMANERTPSGPIAGIETGKKPDVEQQQETPGISTPISQEAPSSTGESQSFQLRDSRLGQILQNIFQRAEGAMQAFRIPGTNKMVVDHRDEGKEGKKGADQKDRAHGSPSQLEIKEGKTHDVHERGYENYLADRKLPFAERQVEGKTKERPLSDFEKLVVERFEKAKTLEAASKDGKAHFLEKTIEQWRDFFAKFSERTGKRVADLSDIQEFLFRGVVKKDAAKAVMISDIIHSDGKTDKFARFSILYQKLGDLFSKLLPGEVVSKQSVAEGLLSEELMYLALNPPDIEKGFIMEKGPKLGMFARESTEARVAKELGLVGYDKGSPQSEHRHIASAKKKGNQGLFKWLMGDKEEVIEDRGQFVPSSLPANRKKIPFITLKRAFYSAVIIGLILVFLFVIDRLLVNK